jgi:hypothetical protein
MRTPFRLDVSVETTTGAMLHVAEYTERQYDDLGVYGCELEARDVCKAAGVEFKTLHVNVL